MMYIISYLDQFTGFTVIKEFDNEKIRDAVYNLIISKPTKFIVKQEVER